MAADFGAKSELARVGIRTLLRALAAGPDRKRCQEPFSAERFPRPADGGPKKVPGNISSAGKGLDSLVAAYSEGGAPCDPLELLLAVQTYYVLVVKLLVWQAIATARRQPDPAAAIRGAIGTDRLLQRIRELESGLLTADLSVAGPNGDDPFAWYIRSWDETLDHFVRRLADQWRGYDFRALTEGTGSDLLKALYQEVFPKRMRHALGEYYTPDWLARQMLDDVGYRGEPDRRLLDPACGSGTFLVLAIRRLRERLARPDGLQEDDRDRLLRAILSGVVGLDLSPLAVVTARANYLVAICDLLPRAGRIELPVHLADSILGWDEGGGDGGGEFDCVVGNPPWIAWDDLPPEYREATKPLWQRYGLFSLSGADARHGGGKKDLSMLMIYAAADRYLKPSGRLAMVVTQTVFQTRGAGEGFRRFRLGAEGPWLRVVGVNDLVDVRPFPGTANWTATIVLEKGRPTVYPVPYVKWSPGGGRQPLDAAPIDPRQPASPWFLWPRGWKGSRCNLIGPSHYEAHLGANTGGANGVYWVTLPDDAPQRKASGDAWFREGEAPAEPCVRVRIGSAGASPSHSEGNPREKDKQAAEGLVRVRNLAGKGKCPVPMVDHLVESELVYPLLRWGDVDRFCAVPKAFLLLVQDAETRRGIEETRMRERYPNAHAYLTQFREVLVGRAAYRRYQSRAAFYSMYDVGPYTLAPFKVVWRRMDRRINAAVVEPVSDPRLGVRPVVPQETCVLIAADSADEAHYLSAVLNSAMIEFLVSSHNVRGGKSFGSPGMLQYLRIARYDPQDAQHQKLAAASREAHHRARAGEPYDEVQDAIDRAAAELWA